MGAKKAQGSRFHPQHIGPIKFSKSDPHGHLTPFLCLVLDVIRSKLQLSSLKAKRRAKAPDGPKNKVRFVATYPDPVGVAAAVDAIVDAPYTDAADVATPAAVDVLAEDANVASVVYADDVVNAVDTIAVDIADYFDAFDAFAATGTVDILTRMFCCTL